jgi:thioredoxin-related protein
MKSLSRLFFFALFFFAGSFAGFSQEGSSVHFEQRFSWAEILAKAKSENKYIFVDCYASWCGPCKMMDRQVYPDPAVGAALNSKFVSVKMQLDTSRNDNPSVQKNYGDAHTIGAQYKIYAYPSFLFFSPDGKLVHRGLGYQEPEQMIALAEAAIDPSTQYYTLVDQYEKNNLPRVQLMTLALGARTIGDNTVATKAANDYINWLGAQGPDSLYTPNNISFIALFTQSPTDKGFDLFTRHADRVDAAMHKKNFSRNTVDKIIIARDIDPCLNKDQPDSWDAITTLITKKYNATIADRTVTKDKIYHSYGSDWPLFIQSLVHYTDTYEDTTDLKLMDKNANYVLQNSTDKGALTRALVWSNNAVQNEPSNTDYQQTNTSLKTKLASL